MSCKRDPLLRLTLASSLLLTALPGLAAVQSDALSRQSTASLDASVEVPAASFKALSEGGKFVITGIKASGETVTVTLSATAAVGSAIVLVFTLAAFEALNIDAGDVAETSETPAGWLLTVGDRTLAFIPNEAAREHLHSRRLGT